MALNPPRTLRTIHNGSNGVVKVMLTIDAGSDLSVSPEVLAQLAPIGAFKDGPAPQALLDALAGPAPEDAEQAALEAKAAAKKPAAKAAKP